MMITIKLPVNLPGKTSKLQEVFDTMNVEYSTGLMNELTDVNYVQINGDKVYFHNLVPKDAFDIYNGRADKKLPKLILEALQRVQEWEIVGENSNKSVQKSQGHVGKEISEEIAAEEKKAYEVILRKAVRELGNGDYTIKVSVFDNSRSTETLVNNKGVEDVKIFIQLKDGKQRFVSIQDCIKMLTLFEIIGEVEGAFGPFSLNFQDQVIDIKDAEAPIGMKKLKEIVEKYI